MASTNAFCSHARVGSERTLQSVCLFGNDSRSTFYPRARSLVPKQDCQGPNSDCSLVEETTLRSVGGVVTSRGIEPRSPALQAGAMTTLARWSEWSRCRGSNPGLLRTGQACCQ